MAADFTRWGLAIRREDRSRVRSEQASAQVSVHPLIYSAAFDALPKPVKDQI
jgi:hypothetical protein